MKAPAGYWLMKSEPGAFSIDDLKRRQREAWDVSLDFIATERELIDCNPEVHA